MSIHITFTCFALLRQCRIRWGNKTFTVRTSYTTAPIPHFLYTTPQSASEESAAILCGILLVVPSMHPAETCIDKDGMKVDTNGSPDLCMALTGNILENIFAKLPPQDILRVCGVSRSWKDTVKKSRPIQRLLFFEKEELSCAYILPEKADDFNKAYRTHNPLHFNIQKMGNFLVHCPAIVNRCFVIAKANWTVLEIDLSGIMRKQLENKDASWRRMYLSQPPDAQGTLVIRDLFNSRHAVFFIREPQGITLGTLVSFYLSRKSFFASDFTLQFRNGRHKIDTWDAKTIYVTQEEDSRVVKQWPYRS